MRASSSGDGHAQLARTVLKALDVLECLAAAGEPLTAQQVARRCGLSRTTAHRLLTTLVSRGYVASVPEGRHRLGAKLLPLSQSVLEHFDLPDLARDALRGIAELSGETT